MTYAELIDRAIFMAVDHAKVPLERLRLQARAIFPSVVEELAQSVAANISHPWRSDIQDATAVLADGDVIPEVGSSGKAIIGVYGLVRDSVDPTQVLSDGFSFEEIRALNANVNSWQTAPVYAFAIMKPRIYHTRTGVTIDVCVLDEADIASAIAADAIPLFPDAEGAYVAALVNKLTNPNVKFVADDFSTLSAKL